MSTNLPVITDLRRAVIPWDGQKISRPGIYSGVPMTNEEGTGYHQDLCDGPSVSHSVLWKADTKSPRHAYRTWYGNPDRREDEEKDHLALGRAIHHLAGGEIGFLEHFSVRPAKWDSWRTKDAKEWRALEKANRPGVGILTPDDVETIRGVANAMNEHPIIQAGILKGLVEMTVVYRDAITGLWVKARPDVLPLGSRMVPDLKTIAEATRRKCEAAIGEWGYHGQMAIIDEALWQVAGFEVEDHVLVFVEKSDPWCLNIKPLDAAAIEWGRAYSRRALDTWARCLDVGVFHGYDDDERDISIPKWLADRYVYESKNGLLPKLAQRQPRALPSPEVLARLAAPSDADEVIL